MNRIIDYNILKSNTSKDLVTKLNDKIDEGWQPFIHGAERVGDCWYQTVVKYKDTVDRIIDYDVVISNQETDVTSKVKRRMDAEGWQPFGEGAKKVNGDWYQTIVRYEVSEEE